MVSDSSLKSNHLQSSEYGGSARSGRVGVGPLDDLIGLLSTGPDPASGRAVAVPLACRPSRATVAERGSPPRDDDITDKDGRSQSVSFCFLPIGRFGHPDASTRQVFSEALSYSPTDGHVRRHVDDWAIARTKLLTVVGAVVYLLSASAALRRHPFGW